MPTKLISALTAIWNNAGTTWTGIAMDVTATAYAAASRLFNLKVGGISVFSITAGGNVMLPNGSVGTPSITFDSDPDTGLYRFAANNLGLAANGALTAVVNTTGVAMQSGKKLSLDSAGTAAAPSMYFGIDVDTGLFSDASNTVGFATAGVEAMRIGASQHVLINTTSNEPASQASGSGVALRADGAVSIAAAGGSALRVNRNTNDGVLINCYRAGSAIGNISITATAVAFNTTSDPRLKDPIPMPEWKLPADQRLAKVAAILEWFTWKTVPALGPQFGAMADKLQVVAPHAVSGEPGAVEVTTDEDGNETITPVYQGVDWSKIIPDMIAALDLARQRIEEQDRRISQLESRQ
jgi:hypothetical protein